MTYRAAGIFSVIADDNRRALLDCLATGDKTAGELSSAFQISRPAIARHIRVLEEAGLVSITNVGRTRVHSLNPEPLREVQSWLRTYDRFWDNRLAKLKAMAEGDSKKDQH